MYAAVAAAREGARVLLVDKSLVGRGGATIMAQMTVASAIGEQEPGWSCQFFRHGYFVVDPDSTADKMVLNRTVSLRDTWAKIEKKLNAAPTG